MSAPISFTHKVNTRSRKMTIRVDGKGQVIVSTPRFVPQFVINKFVESTREWIEQQRAKQKDKPSLLTREYVYYFGKKYLLRKSNLKNGSVRIVKDIIILAPVVDTNDSPYTLLDTWLRSRAREYISKRTEELSTHMKLPFNGMAFRTQKTRWGSCSSTKHLNFNIKLIRAPKAVIDYVIIHELAHTKHMNHGRQFWDLVAKYDPDHPHHRRWLDRYGSTDD